MLKQLQFVRGAVGKGKIDSGLSHFRIRDRRVTGYNGVMAISSPIPCDLDCQPDATTLIKAVGNCKAAVELTVTDAGKIRLRSGTFRVFIDNLTEVLPEVEPEGDRFPIDGAAMINAMTKLVEFVGDDASRPWSNGILFRGRFAYATNNIILAQAAMGGKDAGDLFPTDANVPLLTVREVLRVSEPPTEISLCETSMTFHFSDGRWIRTQMYSTEWPDVAAFLPDPRDPALRALPTGFWDAVETCLPFKDKQNRVYLGSDNVGTAVDQESGAHVRVPGVPDALYNIDYLWSLREMIEKADLSRVPGIFLGSGIRGVIQGMRQ